MEALWNNPLSLAAGSLMGFDSTSESIQVYWVMGRVKILEIRLLLSKKHWKNCSFDASKVKIKTIIYNAMVEVNGILCCFKLVKLILQFALVYLRWASIRELGNIPV